jgi:hypothetical protein
MFNDKVNLMPEPRKIWDKGFLTTLNVVKDFMRKKPGTLVRVKRDDACAIIMIMGILDPLLTTNNQFMTKAICVHTTDGNTFPLGSWQLDGPSVLELLDTSEVQVIYEC